MKSITLLKLKLDKQCYHELQRIGELCRRARNAAIEDWLLRARGMPPSAKQRDGLSESTLLYHAVTAACPSLDTQLAALIAGSISSSLGAKLDWRRGSGEDGKRPRRRDAILDYQDRPPYFSGLEIPVRARTCKLKYGPRTYLDALLERRNHLSLDILTDKLPAKQKQILLAVATGERKQQDSRIVCKDGTWYWYLTVANESLEMDARKMLVLSPVIPADDDKRSDRPFRCEWENEHWLVGEGRYYRAQLERLWRILKEIGWQYRQRSGTGHGRGKYDVATALRRTQMRNIATEFRRKVIVSILSQCERWGCGTILYREPTLPVRELCWFAKRGGLDWDWTRFLGDLKNAAARRGVEVKVERLKMSEVKACVPSPA